MNYQEVMQESVKNMLWPLGKTMKVDLEGEAEILARLLVQAKVEAKAELQEEWDKLSQVRSGTV